jgi:taurine--2-oxoglutarate transaminase
MSGFGRTGKWFAVDHWGVEPDIMTLAKGLTSGYLPLGGVVVSDKIADYFEDKMLYMGLTYFGHPMSCAAGVAALNIYHEENLVDHSRDMGNLLGQTLESFNEKHNSIGDVRYIGLFSTIELVKDHHSKEPVDASVMSAIKNQLQSAGLTTFVSKNMIFACPPLIISRSELMDGLAIIDQAINLADKSIQ